MTFKVYSSFLQNGVTFLSIYTRPAMVMFS